MTTHSRGGALLPFVIPALSLVLVAVLLVSAVFLLTRGNQSEGDHARPPSETSPEPGSAPSIVRDAPSTAPPDGVVLPKGSDQVDGYPTRFPHSDLGPVAAQAVLARAQIGFGYDHAAQVAGIYAAPGARWVLEERSRAAVGLRREQAGVPATGEVPAPASYALTPVAFTLTELDTDYYAVNLLSYVTLTTTDGTTQDSLYAGTQLFRWIEGDWKVVEGSQDDLARLVAEGQPPAARPGTPEFTQAGWILIRGGYQ
jgi:hypothetical protein